MHVVDLGIWVHLVRCIGQLLEDKLRSYTILKESAIEGMSILFCIIMFVFVCLVLLCVSNTSVFRKESGKS